MVSGASWWRSFTTCSITIKMKHLKAVSYMDAQHVCSSSSKWGNEKVSVTCIYIISVDYHQNDTIKSCQLYTYTRSVLIISNTLSIFDDTEHRSCVSLRPLHCLILIMMSTVFVHRYNWQHLSVCLIVINSAFVYLHN